MKILVLSWSWRRDENKWFGTKLDSSVLLIGSPLAGFPVSQCGEPWLQNSQNNLEESKKSKLVVAPAQPVWTFLELQTSTMHSVKVAVVFVMEWNYVYTCSRLIEWVVNLYNSLTVEWNCITSFSSLRMSWYHGVVDTVKLWTYLVVRSGAP